MLFQLPHLLSDAATDHGPVITLTRRLRVEAPGDSCDLAHHLVLLPQLPEVRMLQRLTSSRPFIRVINQQFLDQLHTLRRHMWKQLADPRALLMREVNVDMRGVVPSGSTTYLLN